MGTFRPKINTNNYNSRNLGTPDSLEEIKNNNEQANQHERKIRVVTMHIWEWLKTILGG